MAATQIITEPAVPLVVVTSEFAAPRELLFRAYTDPGLLRQWLGPRELTLAMTTSTLGMAAPGAIPASTPTGTPPC
ncbi:MAG: hypothetical protein M3Z75_29200 [Actinomycetota bacterium]|nr:hypothetical protein [Actinomycetota bacterium]